MRKFIGLLAAAVLLGGGVAFGETIQVTDLAGRTVSVSVPVKKAVLGEGRYLPSLAILERHDPVSLVAGTMGDFKQYDPATYAQYQKLFPHIDQVPVIGRASADSFSLEKTLSLKPGVAIFGLASPHGPSTRHKKILDSLEAAGVPVVIIDFRMDPLTNTPKSLALLGKLFGKEAEAAEFLNFYQAQIDLVRTRLASVTKKPRVFMELHVGIRPECCAAMGRGMMGKFIEWAGGINHVGDKIPGTHGMVNMEYLVTQQPDIYIGTAIGSPMTARKFPNRIVLGTGASNEQARASLAFSARRTGIAQLEAIKAGQAHAIWHHFYNTPLHVAAVQAMAKWFHPELFGDISPRQTLETLFDRFQPAPLNGHYWTSLGDGGAS